MSGWIGVDLDGTLAHYDRWRGEMHIGEPVPEMLERVKRWLSEGRVVKIFTARVSTRDKQELTAVLGAINEWSAQHIGEQLEVTCIKDYSMVCLYDDRVVQVETNTGKLIGHPRPGL